MNKSFADLIELDGYIDNQRNWKNCKLGAYPCSYNGCGWIASYNYLRSMFSQLHSVNSFSNATSVLKEFNKIVWFKGKFGIMPHQIVKVIKEMSNRDLKVKIKFRTSNAIAKDTGIVFYFTGRSMHYVMYEEVEKELYIFHNISRGRITCDFNEFANEYIKAKPFIIIE